MGVSPQTLGLAVLESTPDAVVSATLVEWRAGFVIQYAFDFRRSYLIVRRVNNIRSTKVKRSK